LILHNNAGPLGTAASLHASNASLAAMPNVTLLEAPWANREAETDVAGGAPIWPYPEIEDGYALPLEGPGLGIEARCTQRVGGWHTKLPAPMIPFTMSPSFACVRRSSLKRSNDAR
jgi:hypothetical protein